MITEKDLQEAIAECEGQRNPNANTCIKLAAFYTIKQHMLGVSSPAQEYSFAPEPSPQTGIRYQSDTEFGQIVTGMQESEIMPIIDELMTTLQVVQPRLYAGVIRKIK